MSKSRNDHHQNTYCLWSSSTWYVLFLCLLLKTIIHNSAIDHEMIGTHCRQNTNAFSRKHGHLPMAKICGEYAMECLLGGQIWCVRSRSYLGTLLPTPLFLLYCSLIAFLLYVEWRSLRIGGSERESTTIHCDLPAHWWNSCTQCDFAQILAMHLIEPPYQEGKTLLLVGPPGTGKVRAHLQYIHLFNT